MTDFIKFQVMPCCFCHVTREQVYFKEFENTNCKKDSETKFINALRSRLDLKNVTNTKKFDGIHIIFFFGGFFCWNGLILMQIGLVLKNFLFFPPRETRILMFTYFVSIFFKFLFRTYFWRRSMSLVTLTKSSIDVLIIVFFFKYDKILKLRLLFYVFMYNL